MIIFQNKLIPTILSILCLLTFSCKRVGKEISERIVKETVEEGVSAGSKKAAKSTLKDLGETGLKKLKYDDFIILLKKDFPAIHTSFSNLDKNMQKQVVEIIKSNSNVLDAMLSSRTVIDEFIAATSHLSAFEKNANFFSYYITHPQFASDMMFKQSDNVIELFSKSSNKTLGKYRDGVVDIIEPFIDGKNTFGNDLLKNDFFPNTLYKIRGSMGKQYLFQTDGMGHVLTVEAKNVSPEEIVSNIIRRTDDVNLGTEWTTAYKKLKQHSQGEDLNVTLRFKYDKTNPSPASVKMIAKKDEKEILSSVFENANHLRPKKFTAEQNSKLLRSLQNKLNIPEEKLIVLQNLMESDPGFCQFIHSNPEFNVGRWLKTRNHVDQSLIKVLPNGRMPANARTYAGNVYYFNPYLNPQLANRLTNKNGLASLKKAGILSREQLEELDRLYPNGVPFSKSGYPDFSGVAFKGEDGKPMAIDIKNLSGDSKQDIGMAEGIFQSMGYKSEPGYTWHHVEGTTILLRVPTEIHQLIDHAGGMAMSVLN